MDAENKRILLADDHTVVRTALRSVLSTDRSMIVCGEAATGDEAVQQAEALRPDLIVLDISMPGRRAPRVIEEVCKLDPPPAVLVFTMHDNEQVVREVLTAGARGYVLKCAPAETILQAARTLLNRQTYFCSEITGAVLKGYLSPGNLFLSEMVDGKRALTSQELAIVQLLSRSHNNRTVAAMLAISPKTVESHRMNIMRKLGAHSLADIVRYAVRNNLVAA